MILHFDTDIKKERQMDREREKNREGGRQTETDRDINTSRQTDGDSWNGTETARDRLSACSASAASATIRNMFTTSPQNTKTQNTIPKHCWPDSKPKRDNEVGWFRYPSKDNVKTG